MFRLLCLCHTDAVCQDLDLIFFRSSINLGKFFKSFKLYILMIEWFHENNLKQVVSSAEALVSEIPELLHHAFP